MPDHVNITSGAVPVRPLKNQIGAIAQAFILAPLPLPFLLALSVGQPVYAIGLFPVIYLLSWIVLLLFGLPWHVVMHLLRLRSVFAYLAGGALGGLGVWLWFFGRNIEGLRYGGYGADYLWQLGLCLCLGTVCAGIFWAVVVRPRNEHRPVNLRLDQTL
ncbi:MAG: hypothetical protein QM667_01650 [Asticcacaulis sp.]